jgi:hypothetical protein
MRSTGALISIVGASEIKKNRWLVFWGGLLFHRIRLRIDEFQQTQLLGSHDENTDKK